MSLNKINNKKYINYNRNSCINYYNEIQDFILKKIIPSRLKNKEGIKRKTQSKRRGKFRKMIENKYRIINNRLQYKYSNNKIINWLNIPFQNEVETLLNYIHYNNNHLKKDRMVIHVIDAGFFWFGFSSDIDKFIKKCGKNHCENNIEKIEKENKIIISKGPHITYQADIWYLPKELKKNNILLN